MEEKKTLAEVAKEIAAEVKNEAAQAEQVVEKAFVELELADKFLVSQIESSFLKVQVELQQHQSEINRLQNLAKQIQDKFKADTETLFKKYGKTIETDILDVTAFVIRKRTPQEKQQ